MKLANVALKAIIFFGSSNLGGMHLITPLQRSSVPRLIGAVAKFQQTRNASTCSQCQWSCRMSCRQCSNSTTESSGVIILHPYCTNDDINFEQAQTIARWAWLERGSYWQNSLKKNIVTSSEELCRDALMQAHDQLYEFVKKINLQKNGERGWDILQEAVADTYQRFAKNPTLEELVVFLSKKRDKTWINEALFPAKNRLRTLADNYSKYHELACDMQAGACFCERLSKIITEDPTTTQACS